MGEKELIGMAGLMAAEVMKEDTDAREESYVSGLSDKEDQEE